MKKKLLLASAFWLLASFSYSQSNQNLPLAREHFILYESYLQNSNIHTAIKPLTNSHELNAINDSINTGIKHKSPADSLHDQKSIGNIFIHPLFTSQFGHEQAERSGNKFLLDGGLALDVRINDKLSFNSTFVAGNSSFPSYIDTSIAHSHVDPGMGAAYSSKQGYSYQYYSGYLSYSPNKIFNFQAGRDKHFWGDGYRSLFLSDISSPFPFLKISTTVWKLKYVNLFAAMKDITASPLKNDQKNKYATFHYLSWNVSKRLNLSVFESIVWQGNDTNRSRGFDVNYLNPVIFFRPIEYSLGSSDNAFLGGSFKIKAGKKFRQQFYGQLILDEFLLKEVLAVFKKLAHPFDHSIPYGWWGNKQGVQLGFKSFDLFTLKNLTFQTEINAVRPYTYSHGSVQQNYANYNQSLAHPLGANFAESVSFLNYRYKKWMFETEFLYAIYGKDEKGKNWGQNIFESYSTHPMEYGNKFFQGLKTNLTYSRFKVAYLLVSDANLMAEAGVAMRQETNTASSLSSVFFFIGIKTSILNRYSDF